MVKANSTKNYKNTALGIINSLKYQTCTATLIISKLITKC